MSTNMVYQSNTNQDIVFHQSNPSYIKASDIHIYDEIPANQYEEPAEVMKDTTLNDKDNGSYVSQGNKEDQDNGSYVSQGNKEDQDNGSYVSQGNQEDQDNRSYVSQGNQEDQNDGSYVSQGNQEDQDDGSYVSQGNQEDQDNGSYVSQGNKEDHDYVNAGVTDDKAQAEDIKESCENLPNEDDDDYI